MISDSTAGNWTTPDAYGGDVDDPGSQKGYMRNGNNAISYADPTGFSPVVQGNDGTGSTSSPGGQPEFTDWSLTGTAGIDTPSLVPNTILQSAKNHQTSKLSTLYDAALADAIENAGAQSSLENPNDATGTVVPEVGNALTTMPVDAGLRRSKAATLIQTETLE